MARAWLVDFDDTLATGPTTWGYQQALPKLIRDHKLPVVPDRLERALLEAQAEANLTVDLDRVLGRLFEVMQWPQQLQHTLLADVQDNYTPQLFDDAIPFLQNLRRAEHFVIIVSNNPRMPGHAQRLGVSDWTDELVTPAMFPGTKPKPDRGIWDRLRQAFPSLDGMDAAVVGDDPWSDLAFAEVCQMSAWLLDRFDRFGAVQLSPNARRVQSLLQIPVVS